MKKHCTLLLILFSAVSFAQTYHPLLDSVNTWYYTSNVIGVRLSQQPASTTCYYPVTSAVEQTTTDTLIDSLTYKTLIGDYNGCVIGYMREDTSTGKVYFMDNTFAPEVMIYDFSMQTGDTLPVSFFNTTSFYYPSGTYTVDSTGIIHIRAGFRKIIYLSRHSCTFSPEMVWIESVGNPNGIAYPVSGDYFNGGCIYCGCAGDYHMAYQIMTCFYHNTKVYEDSCMLYEATHQYSCIGFTDSCDYGNICGAVHEFSSLASFDVFPNPSMGKATLRLQVSHADEFEVYVRDVSGRQIIRKISLGRLAEGERDVDLDLSAMENGFYLIEVRSATGSSWQKLILQH